MSAGFRSLLAHWLGGASTPAAGGPTGEPILCEPMFISAFVAAMDTDFIAAMLTDAIMPTIISMYVPSMIANAHVQPMTIRCAD